MVFFETLKHEVSIRRQLNNYTTTSLTTIHYLDTGTTACHHSPYILSTLLYICLEGGGVGGGGWGYVSVNNPYDFTDT